MHTDHKSASILDNFNMNAALLPYVEDAGPLHLGDNPSGHSHILMHLRVSDIPRQPKEEEVRFPRRLAWQKEDSVHPREYKNFLKKRLQEMEDPKS